jgi:hypothetical protein
MGKGRLDMPRVLVVADGPEREVVMEEWVDPEHIDTRHSASQLIERLAWGVEDAARVEQRFKSIVAPARLGSDAARRSYLEV